MTERISTGQAARQYGIPARTIRRDGYTWDDLSRDLAMGSRLTYGEACAIRNAMESTDAHPYDALRSLAKLFGGEDVQTEARPSIPSWLDPRRPEVFWCDASDLSRATLDRGLVLTDSLAELAGHVRPSVEGFSLCFFDDERSEFPVGRSGSILLLPNGDNPGALIDAWPAEVASWEVVRESEGPHVFKMNLKVTGKPTKRRRIPS